MGGGRAHNGAVQQIIWVVEEVQTRVFYSDCEDSTRNVVVLALLDVSKAFDKFNRNVLIKKLIDLGICDKLLQIVISFFHNRTQRVCVDNEFSNTTRTCNGGPQGSVITLFCWLVYINDLATAAGSALFVDDVSLWLSSPNAPDVITKLNQELTRIYNWSVANSVIFDFKKFHLFDLGLQRLPSGVDSQVFFGNENPPWSTSAKYLGLVVDNNLSFVSMITNTYGRLCARAKLFFNHTNRFTGADPKTLENMFKIWILPVFDYASPVWIFRIRDLRCFHFESPLLTKYKKPFGKLNKFYMKCARNVLGVPPGTGNMAVLVRLGWLPLDYFLALRACVWYLKVIKGEAGLAAKRLVVDTFADDELWTNTCLFKPAFSLLTRLSKLTGINIFDLSPKDRVEGIKSAMFQELTMIWHNATISRFTFGIHPVWKENNLERQMVNRRSICIYHQYAVGRAPTRDYYFSIHKCDSPLCRFGCPENETINHVVFSCKFNSKQRAVLIMKCNDLKINFTLKNLLINKSLQILVEKFLLNAHNDN